MGWLLSYFSPGTLSWGGFVVLAIALVGEAGVALIAILSKGETLHKELAFILAIVAAGGYAVERIGDDAIIAGLESRANAAENELRTIKTPRTITDSQYAIFVDCLKAAPKGPIYVRPGFFDRDARELGERLTAALKDANFPEPPPWPGGNSLREVMTWNLPGVFLVLQNLENPPPGATSVQQCLDKIGIRAPGYPTPNHPAGTTSIGIGPRF